MYSKPADVNGCYSAHMLLRFLQKFRIALAALIGLAIALATIAGIFLSLKVNPDTLHLADRIDATHSILYVSTPDRAILFGALHRYQNILSIGAPKEVDIAVADRYEFALIQTGSGETAWILDSVNTTKGTHVMQASKTDVSLLPLTERRQSLASTPLFKSVSEPTASFAWFDTAAIPLPESESALLVQAALSSYSEGLIQFDAVGRGRLSLIGQTKPLHGNAGEIPNTHPLPLLGISLSEPAAVLQNFGTEFTAKDPALLEGMTGILKAQLQKLTGSTDVNGLADDLLTGPFTIIIKQGDADALLFALSGTATSAKVFDQWKTSILSLQTEGIIRTKEFFEKEYTRTDVTAKQVAENTASRDYKNWILDVPQGSGAELSLMTAQKARKYILGNNEQLIKSMIDADAGMPSSGVSTGSADMTWFASIAKAHMPFLGSIRETVEAFFGTFPSRLVWKVSTIPNGIIVDWQIN